MRILTLIMMMTILSYTAHAEDHYLRVTAHDPIRNRATFIMLDQSGLTPGQSLRVHTKMGTCMVKILDIINESLITQTDDCNNGIITTNMRLSYSIDDFNDWPTANTSLASDNRSHTSFDDNFSFLELIHNRLSVHLGYNFSSKIEGKAYADGRVKDLEGDSTLAFGVLGRIYNFNPILGLTLGLGHEFARSFDRATHIENNQEVIKGFGQTGNPRLSIWSLYAQVEAELIPKLNVFGGLNYSIPSESNTRWDVGGDFGFQAGLGYEVYPQVDVEAMLKMTNMDLKNELGETTDISLTGLEVRGRYTF